MNAQEIALKGFAGADIQACARKVLDKFDGAPSIEAMREGAKVCLYGINSPMVSPGAHPDTADDIAAKEEAKANARRSADLKPEERKQLIDNALKASKKYFGLEGPKAFLETLLNEGRIDRFRSTVPPPDGHVEQSEWDGENIAALGDQGCGKTTFIREVVHPILFATGKVVTDYYEETSFTKLEGGAYGKAGENAQGFVDRVRDGFGMLDESHKLHPDSEHVSPYREEVVEALIPALENNRRGTIIALLGYPEQMLFALEKADSGLLSRLPYPLFFECPPLHVLTDMAFDKAGRFGGFRIEPESRERVEQAIQDAAKLPGFAYGRSVRSLVKGWIGNLNDRLSKLDLTEET
ncbi:MAG: AAA family ATPase, partial [Myxococcota bacterium]